MCSVYKEKAILRDQYPSVKVGEPSKTTYRCSSELCKATYLIFQGGGGGGGGGGGEGTFRSNF